MGAVVIAARYVPRPPDDSVWQFWAPPRARESVLDKVGGGFPFKPNFSPVRGYDEPGTWRFAPEPVNPVNRLVGGNFPFKPSWFGQQFTYNDAGNEWQFWSPPRTREQVLDLVGGNFPFKPRWRILENYADAGNEWRGASDQVNVSLYVVATAPFAPRFWKYNYDEAAPWLAEPVPVNSVSRLTNGNFPLTPRFWAYNYADAGNEWRAGPTPVNPVIALVNGNNPFKPRFWKYDYNEAPPWPPEPVPVPPLFRVVVSTPFEPNFWRYNTDEAPVWRSHPIPVNRVIDVVPAPLPFLPDFSTSRGYDERSLWTYKAKPVSLQLLLQNVVIQGPTGYLTATELADTARFVVALAPAGPGDLQYGWPDVIVRRRL